MIKFNPLKWLTGLLLILAIVYGATFWLLRNPTFPHIGTYGTPAANAERLEQDVRFLASINPARSFYNVPSLDKAALFIEQEFVKAGCTPYRQTYEVKGNKYHNIICALGPEKAPKLVVGAHYDVAHENNPGADDNASGVAGILELARLLKQKKPNLQHRVELVAYTLEEPPAFRTKHMGSYVYAKQQKDDSTDIRLSISVEMIGFYSDEKDTQHFPSPLLKLFYPDTGNFLAVVGSTFDRKNVATVKALLGKFNRLPVYSINAPASIPGIDFSDHLNFWALDMPAVMVTDTAFLRNANYHQPTDTPDTLDYIRMGWAVDGLYSVIVGLDVTR